MADTKNKNSFLSVFLEVAGLVILATCPRLILLLEGAQTIESDEAIVGLMGKHILEGKGIPVFYYGQAYMGSLEAILVAISFYFLGISTFALKLIPFCFSLFLVVTNYTLAFIIGGRPAARISGLLTAIGPSPLIIWSLKARGGFMEMLVLGSLALIVTAILCKRKNGESHRDRALWLFVAFFLGLGWWVNNQIIFYMAPIGLILLARLYSSRAKLIGKTYLVLACIVVFLLSGAPFWYYNLTHKPKWSSFEVLFGSTAGGSSFSYFLDYWDIALPIILGARKFWADTELFPFAKSIYYSIYFILLCFVISGYFYKSKNHLLKEENQDDKANPSVSMLLLFLFFVPVIFSLSSFGWLSQAPRYLLPLYSVLPVLAGLGIQVAGRSSKIILRGLGRAITILLIALNLTSNYLEGVADEGEPMVFLKERVAKNQDDLYRWLEKEGYNHIYTNYWIGYRTAFETLERIKFTRFGKPRSLRIQDYEKGNEPAKIAGKVFVLVPAEAREFERWLTSTGMIFRKTKLSHYTILDKISYKYPEGRQIQISPDDISFFIPPWGETAPEIANNLSTLIDGNPLSRWGSGKPQKAGMAIEVKISPPMDIGRVLINHGPFKHDIARSLRISGYADGTEEHVILFDMSKNRFYRDMQEQEFSDIPSEWDIRFGATKLKRLRLELMEDSSIFDWSISDLKIFSTDSE
ncbi:MAG TPA: hypothetical protein PKA63_12825 [Oligoflexia bacterium]|nr:hypothetical protein [Oligoflexia bacterium]